MSVGLIGCGGASVGPAVDLSEIKVPEVRPAVIAELKSRPAAPAAPVTRVKTADWIDRLRMDIEQKASAGWELAETVNQCRAPLKKLAVAH
jgi:hypothetical protein